MCQKCDARRRQILVELALALDPRTPKDKLPWLSVPYNPMQRGVGIAYLQSLHSILVVNALSDARVSPNDPAKVEAVNKLMKEASVLINALSDDDLGRLVFFGYAYETTIELDFQSALTKVATMKEDGYYRMPTNIAAELLSFFPTKDMIKDILTPTSDAAAEALKADAPKDQAPKVVDLGGGIKMAEFTSFDDLLSLMERGGLH